MAALDENLSKKTDKIINKDLEEGQEMAGFQEAQNHLLQLQAAQRQNLQVERATSEARSQNNQTMAQAAEMMAASGGGEQVQQQLNPQTQAILSKYGYGRPGTQTSSSSKTTRGPVQGREVIINTKTENKTTNNINIATPPATVVKNSGDGGMSKFKTWVTSSFAKQREQDAIRAREYDRKEWSLSRSTNKLMKSIEDMGKTMGERLDPRKIASSMMDQMKLLFFLLGFQYIAKNWKNIIRTAAKVEGWLKGVAEYFGISVSLNGKNFSVKFNKKNQFTKDLIRFLGGDPNRDTSAFRSLINLFKEGVELLWEKFKIMMNERVSAMRAVKFPPLGEESGPIDILKGFGTYLSDLLACLFAGAKGLTGNALHSMDSVSKVKMTTKPDNDPGIVRFNMSTAPFSNTSWGDAVVISGGPDGRGQNYLNSFDLDSEGHLTNNYAASIKQSKWIGAEVKKAITTGEEINSASILKGLDNLLESSKKWGKTLVRGGFFEGLAELGVKMPKRGVSVGNYKFVKRKKTEQDYINEGASSAYSGVIGGAKGYLTGGGEIAQAGGALLGAAEGGINRAFADENTLEMVPASDPRPAEPVLITNSGKAIVTTTGMKNTQKIFPAYELSPIAIEDILRQLNALTVDNSDTKSILARLDRFDNKIRKRRHDVNLTQAVKLEKQGKRDKALEYRKRADLAKRGMYSETRSESDYQLIRDSLKEQARIEEETRAANQEWDDKFYGSSLGRLVSGVSADLSDGKEITAAQEKENILTAMNYFINTEGLTPEQAAGFVGNLYHESYLDPHRKNPTSTAYGIAQWIESRRRDFEQVMHKPIEQSDLMDQLEYISHQLKYDQTYGTVTNKLIRTKNTPEDAAEVAFGHYEFSGGVKDAIAELYKHKQNGDASYRDRLQKARNVYVTYMSNIQDIKEGEGGEVLLYDTRPKKPVNLNRSASQTQMFSPANTKIANAKRKSTSDGQYKKIHKKGDWVKGKDGKYHKVDTDVYKYTPENNIPNKPKVIDYSKSLFHANVDYDAFKDLDNSSVGYLKDIVDGIEMQSKNIAMLSNEVRELTIVAASSGNVTNTVVNNGSGGGKANVPSFTPDSSQPYSWEKSIT